MRVRQKEIFIDRLVLESFANDRSPYFTDNLELSKKDFLNKFRNKLKWHINNSLSPRQKEVILYYLNGKKEREIATILGVAQQVVNIYKHRAIKKLQKIMAS